MATDTYATYAEAAGRAKFLARTFQTAVQLRAACSAWEVLLPGNYRPELDSMGRHASPSTDWLEDEAPFPSNHGYDDYDDDGEGALLSEELAEDRENWARSDEDGWFYPD